MAGEEQQDAPVEVPAGEAEQGQDPGEVKQVEDWLKRIEAAKKHWKDPFGRMAKCQQLAAYGAYKEWLADEMRYVVPVLNRHVNQAVSQLYAKNPTPVAEQRKRLLHTVWDGTPEMIAGPQGVVADAQAKAMAGLPFDPQAAAEAQQALQAIQADIAQAQAQENLTEKAAETLTLLQEYQIDQQPYAFKTNIKSTVRRTKVNGIGWCKLTALREMEMRPETAALAEDTQAKLRSIERLREDLVDEEKGEEHERMAAELRQLVADLQASPDRVVREQIIYDFPRSREIVLDPETRHLKTLAGCAWLAHQFDFTADRIRDIWGVDIEEEMSEPELQARDMMSGDGCDERKYRVYEVQDKYRQQVCVVAEGCKKFIKVPAEPDIWLERFFTLFPLVFNEIEHDEDIYPPSDIWAARHMQFEYNRSREGLREHRVAARPFWVARKGQIEQEDKRRLQNHNAHEIVEVTVSDPKMPVSAVVERGPTPPIDPNLYEVEMIHTDMLRSIGTQEANLGGTSGATATESSIAETSRMSSLSDNVDDLDDWLTEIMRASGQVALQMFSAERVKEIVGPGAVWPEMQLSRKQLADEITLSIKAGSSGRPNQAAKLANMERGAPTLLQLPGINPEPLARTYADLLDMDPDELFRPEVMSITAQNAIAGSAPPMGEVPAAQGPAGRDNEAGPPPSTGGQPTYQTEPGPESL